MVKKVLTWMCVVAVILGIGITPGHCDDDWQLDEMSDEPFYNGYVWEKYINSDGVPYFVCVDEHGKAKFQLTDALDFYKPSRYEGEYIQILNKFKGYLINFDGNGDAITYIPYDNNHQIAAYGAGYTVIFAKASGFDSSGYFYVMYDPYGKIILSKEVDGSVSFGDIGRDTTIRPSWSDKTFDLNGFIRYCGEGVFYIDGNLYFTKSGDVVTSHNIAFHFYDDGWSDVAYSSKSVLRINSDGEMWTVDSPCEISYANGLVVGNAPNGEWYSYDMDDGKWYKLDDYYASRIMGDSYEQPVLSNGNINVAQMIGNDGESYYAMFDMQWNLIIEPTEGYIQKFEDGFLLVDNGIEYQVFNSDGEYVPTTDSFGLFFGDDLIIDNDNILDRDGTTLFNFNDVDFSKTIDLTDQVAKPDESITVALADNP